MEANDHPAYSSAGCWPEVIRRHSSRQGTVRDPAPSYWLGLARPRRCDGKQWRSTRWSTSRLMSPSRCRYCCIQKLHRSHREPRTWGVATPPALGGASYGRRGHLLPLSPARLQIKARHICVRPNPSIERTCPGKPGQASHLKRLTSQTPSARVLQPLIRTHICTVAR